MCWQNVLHKQGNDCAAAMCVPVIARSTFLKEISASAWWEPSLSYPAMVLTMEKRHRFAAGTDQAPSFLPAAICGASIAKIMKSASCGREGTCR